MSCSYLFLWLCHCDCDVCRGLRNPQQRTGADGTPAEVPRQSTEAARMVELERKNSKLARKASQKLQWKPLDMSVSSDVAEITSPFNKAGAEGK
jgi:hypothetical protein